MAELVSLKKQRSTIKAKLTNITKFIATITENTDVEAIRTRVSRVDSLITEFTIIEGKIFALADDEEPDFEFEEKYYVTKTRLNSILRERTIMPGHTFQADTKLNSSHIAQAEVKLPKINIPQFSGEYTEWQSFYDLFSTTIHDSAILSPVQKFQYLKGSLKGEAAALLRHISVTEANYLEAVKKLRNRYDRKKHIMNSFIRAFVDHPPFHTANAAKVKNLLDSADEVVRGLKALGPTAESRDPWLIYWLVTKLDDKSKCMWAETSAELDNLSLDDFFKFLQIRIDALESLSSSMRSGQSKGLIRGHVAESEPVTPVYTCAFCQDKNHSLFSCSEFNNLMVNQRREWINTSQRCFNCLSRGHLIINCQSKRRCRTCGGKHHTLLHINVAQIEEASDSRPSTSIPNEPVTNLNASVVHSNGAKVLRLHSILPTALITVLDMYGEPQVCRTLLDSGSQANFITESCVRRLKLKRFNSRIAVSDLGMTKAGLTRGRTTIIVQPPSHSEFEISALILPKLTSLLPPEAITNVSTEMWSTLKLADPHFNQPGEIDMLIGADHFFSMLLDGRKQCNQEGPSLQNTIFGWVVSGRSEREQEFTTSLLATNYLEPAADLDATLKRFWEIESINEDRTILSAKEKLCEQHFKENVTRNSNGRFVVSLPFKKPAKDLSNTLNIAIQRLRSMERRFERDHEFKALYHTFMTEYEQLHHMEETPKHELTNQGYYLPHHGVLKTTSTTTKLRVVFDGSAMSNTGQSLNNYLAVGPTIQSTLYSIILRFREHKVAMSADIEKMYRQVLVNPKDTKYQQIVWHRKPSDPISYYRLRTVTYGLSNAPFLAIRCLKQIVEEQKLSNPMVCHEIDKNIYVDDLMTAVDTEEEGIQLRQNISNTLAQYGFQLRKWSSNCTDVLNSVPNREDIGKIKELDNESTMGSAPHIKVLGVSWDPQNDNFIFKTSLQNHTSVTKRVVLSEASRLFDPLGWLAPVVVLIKIFMQKLWILNLRWDDPLPSEQNQQWERIRNNLQEVELITIPRFIHSSYHTIIDIHGFCDASESAYAAVVYFKITTPPDVYIQLVTSKTKVAPIKEISVPRLELCGAGLLAKLIETVNRETSLKINNIVSWTDSKIVLDWLADEPRRWATCIASRTSMILDIIPRSNWKYVPSSDNPADCASRGLLASKLRQHDLWWKGPDWLNHSDEHWPQQESSYGTNQEERPTKIEALGGFLTNELYDTMLSKYSSYFKLQRVIAYITRFINNSRAKQKTQRIGGLFLRPDELHIAFKVICAYEQERSYHEAILTLKRIGTINKSSCLNSLSPFLNRENLLRVGGRIVNSAAPYSTKHPVILSPKSILTRLILEDLHKIHNHAGPSLLLSIFRQRYWSTSGRTVVREITRKCVVCRRYQATLQHQIMGNLPTSRVELVRPFHKTGVDFAGPLSIYLIRGRGQRTYKAYISVFVCLSTRAVHFELVGDLSSESFKKFHLLAFHTSRCASFRRHLGGCGEISQISPKMSDRQNYFNDGGNDYVVSRGRKLLKLETYLCLVG